MLDFCPNIGEYHTKQHIGNVFSNRVEGVTEMNFQIWKGATPINPSSWIAK